MPEIKATLSDEAHRKLKILAVLSGRTQSEVIEYLIKNARVPKTDWGYILADETSPETGQEEMDLEELEKMRKNEFGRIIADEY